MAWQKKWLGIRKEEKNRRNILSSVLLVDGSTLPKVNRDSRKFKYTKLPKIKALLKLFFLNDSPETILLEAYFLK